MNAVIGVFQHLCQHPLHVAVTVFREVARQRREQRLEQLIFTQLQIRAVAITRLQQLQGLFKQARRRDITQQRGQTWNRLGGFRRNAHIELGGKARDAQHAHRIFAVAGFRIANQANDALFEIADAANVVTYAEISHAVVEAVDGEIAALGIIFDRAEDIVAQQHTALGALRTVTILRDLFNLMMTTEGGDFDHFRAKHHVCQTETPTDQATVAEQRAHLLRRGVSGHVEIFGFLPQEQIAHATAYQIGFITGFVQAIEHFEGIFADVFT